MRSQVSDGFPIDALRRESLASVLIEVEDGVGRSAKATGFYAKFGDRYFLITARHVVLGLESGSASDYQNLRWRPRFLKTRCFRAKPTREFHVLPVDICLYNERQMPIWLEHEDWDICAIDVTKDVFTEGYIPIAIELSEMTLLHDENGEVVAVSTDFYLPKVAEDVFVVGFPSSIEMLGENSFPVWKKASIATEPHFALKNGHPIYLIDSLGRGGLSGSPVFFSGELLVNFDGLHEMRPNPNKKMHLVGLYVGREGISASDPFTLGRVYKRHAIQDTILGKSRQTDESAD